MVHHIHANPDTHVLHMSLTSISKLAPFSALILTIALVILFVLRYYLLERLLLPKFYGSIYLDQSEVNKRGFLNHHMAGVTKLVILVVAAYPLIDVAFGHADFDSPFAGSALVTMGDILVVCTQIFVAIYVFELMYRSKISPISIFHHVGTTVIGQTAIAISLNFVHEKDADIEVSSIAEQGSITKISSSKISKGARRLVLRILTLPIVRFCSSP